MAGGSTRGADAHVALLRGINVAGKHKLPMKVLVEVFSDLGCRDVRTYIQSGNVLFRAPASLTKRVPDAVAAAIRDRFGFDAPVVTRTARELQRIAGANPFAGRTADHKALHVAFLAARPTRARVQALDPSRSPPDELAVCGAEIYLLCPNGIGRSKLTTAYFDAALATTATLRNWRTVTTLLELVERG